MKNSHRTNEQVLQDILKHHPGLTREEALQYAAEAGFDLTDSPPEPSSERLKAPAHWVENIDAYDQTQGIIGGQRSRERKPA